MVSFKNSLTKFIASGFGIGTVRYPLGGVWGVILGIIVALLVNDRGFVFKVLLLLILILATILLTSRAEKYFGKGKDPHCIVVDEVSGILLTSLWFNIFKMITLFGALKVPLYLIVVLVYGFFDLTKPFPAFRIQRLPGGWGIVLDDLIAATYTTISIAIILRIFG